MTDAISTFFHAWSLSDVNERLELVSRSVADGATYADPRTAEPLTGAQAIADYVGAFSQAAPGAEAVVTDTQTRHGMTRATIAFRMPGGMEQMGQYFVQCGDDGKITSMTGFVGTGAPT